MTGQTDEALTQLPFARPTPDDELLGADPFDDDFVQQLRERAPGQYVNRTTYALAAVLLAVAGFVAGVLVQKGQAGTGTAATPGFGASAGANAAAGRFGQGAGGNPARPDVTGTVTLVDGSTIYVTTADGQVLTVRTTAATTVTLTQTTTLAHIAKGANVVVAGATAADGTVAATQVTVRQ